MTPQNEGQEWAEPRNVLGFLRYLERRQAEVGRAVGPGVGLDSPDPFLNGFGQGVRCGLELAAGLAHSYLECVAGGLPVREHD